MFFVSVKRLVRICACRNLGWSDPGEECARACSEAEDCGVRTEAPREESCVLGMTKAQARVLSMFGVQPSVGGSCACVWCFERDKGIRWMPWHQEAMKDVARCEKPWGAASRL